MLFMTNTFFCSDWHFGHRNILEYSKEDRPFSSVEEHDEALIENHNSVVKPEDRVYFLGDAVINKRYLHNVSRLNGRKICIMGNHDAFAPTILKEQFYPLFDAVLGTRDMHFGQYAATVGHKPTHPHELDYRYHFCIHGHLHSNDVSRMDIIEEKDLRYVNVSMEKIGLTPITHDELHTIMKERMEMMKQEQHYYKNCK